MEADTKSKCINPPITAATVKTKVYTGPRRTNQSTLGDQLPQVRPTSHANASVSSLGSSSCAAAARPGQLSRTTSMQTAIQRAEYSGQPARHIPSAQTDQFSVGYCEHTEIDREVERRFIIGKRMLKERNKECGEKNARLYMALSSSSDAKLIEEERIALEAEMRSIAVQDQFLDETRRKPIPDLFDDHVLLKTESRELQARNAEKDYTIKELQKSSTLKDRKIEDLKAENSAKDDEIRKKSTTIVELEKEKEDSKKDVALVREMEEQKQEELENYRRKEAAYSQQVTTLLKNKELLNRPPFHEIGDVSTLPGLSITPAKRHYECVSIATAQNSVNLKPPPTKKVRRGP